MALMQMSADHGASDRVFLQVERPVARCTNARAGVKAQTFPARPVSSTEHRIYIPMRQIKAKHEMHTH